MSGSRRITRFQTFWLYEARPEISCSMKREERLKWVLTLISAEIKTQRLKNRKWGTRNWPHCASLFNLNAWRFIWINLNELVKAVPTHSKVIMIDSLNSSYLILWGRSFIDHASPFDNGEKVQTLWIYWFLLNENFRFEASLVNPQRKAELRTASELEEQAAGSIPEGTIKVCFCRKFHCIRYWILLNFNVILIRPDMDWI